MTNEQVQAAALELCQWKPSCKEPCGTCKHKATRVLLAASRATPADPLYTKKENLIIGRFYWVRPANDPDTDNDWEREDQPARFNGCNDDGELLWNCFGVEDASNWPMKWIGPEVKFATPADPALDPATVEACLAAIYDFDTKLHRLRENRIQCERQGQARYVKNIQAQIDATEAHMASLRALASGEPNQ